MELGWNPRLDESPACIQATVFYDLGSGKQEALIYNTETIDQFRIALRKPDNFHMNRARFLDAPGRNGSQGTSLESSTPETEENPHADNPFSLDMPSIP